MVNLVRILPRIWLVDKLIIAYRTASSISAIFRMRTRNEGMDGSTRPTISACHCKGMESYIRTKNFDFCNGYNAPISEKKIG